jgi:arginyl-tRNA--protein-N-Asp/Glu arginylyltransferase
MKLLFSEYKPDYPRYIYPYAVWAFPEEGEEPADFFERGFLPSSKNLDRFYLCRQIRVDLRKYTATSENRRILRKGREIRMTLVPRGEFDFTEARREFCKSYADEKFKPDGMSFERLDALFGSPVTSHALVFEEAGKELGIVSLYLVPGQMAYYYYAFYDLKHAERNLGMFMMTSAVEHFAAQKYKNIYLGSCYSQSALYKTQFGGVEFFNGMGWSENLEELKYILKRGQQETISEHLLESEEFRRLFHGGDLARKVEESEFRIKTG